MTTRSRPTRGPASAVIKVVSRANGVPLPTLRSRCSLDGAPPPSTGGLAKLKMLDLRHTQVTDAGCATLVAALDSGSMPAPLNSLHLVGIPASIAAIGAVHAARDKLIAR